MNSATLEARSAAAERPPTTTKRVPVPVRKFRHPPRFRTMIVAIVLFAGAVLIGMRFFAAAQSYQSTDDAFIDGHIINVAPQIAGRVAHVSVRDNQMVKKGDVLIELDQRDFAAALRQKQAAEESARAQAEAVVASIDQAKAHVGTLQATIESDQAAADADRANADKAQKDLVRNQELAREKVISPQDLDSSKASADSSQATLQAALKKVVSDRAQVAEALAQVNTYISLHDSLVAKIGQSDADVQTAQLNQSYTEVRAPEDGRVTRKSVEPGNYLQAGQTILSLIPAKIWVTANFKENQLALMRPGQPVEIAIDALPGRKFGGTLDSIQAGSGARFSLLPPENATGNYVKVVQRVPVKILFSQNPGEQLPLGPGESVVPTIKVQDFRYSSNALLDVAILFALGVGVIVWWGTRLPREKKAAKAV